MGLGDTESPYATVADALLGDRISKLIFGADSGAGLFALVSILARIAGGAAGAVLLIDKLPSTAGADTALCHRIGVFASECRCTRASGSAGLRL